MNKTSISWCDFTWNPITGCTKVSEGCRHCYAEAITRRFHAGRPFTARDHKVELHQDRLNQPTLHRKPARMRDAKGETMTEWPKDLQVRELPRGSR